MASTQPTESPEPTESPQEAVRIEVEQSSPAPAGMAVGPPAEDIDTLGSPPAEDVGTADSPPVEDSGAQRAKGGALLLADARTALLLINHARKRALVQAFGISPDQANAVTAIGLLLIANAAHDKLAPLLRGSAAPPPGDALIAGASVRALLGAIAGPAVDETPGLSTLIVLALAATAAGPTAVRSLHALRSGSYRLTVGFRHRYGYVVDPGHLRARRAQRRQARGREPSTRPASPGV